MPQTLTIYKQNKYNNQTIIQGQQKNISQLSQKNKLQRQIQILKQEVKRLKIQQMNQKIIYEDQKYYKHNNNFIQNINNQEENVQYIHKHLNSQLQSQQTSNKNSRYSQTNTVNFRVGKIVKNSQKINNKINNNIPAQFSRTLQVKVNHNHNNNLLSNIRNNRYEQTNSQLTNNNENLSQQTNQLYLPSTTNKKIDNHFKTIQLKPSGVIYTQRDQPRYSINKINRKVKQNHQDQLKGFDPTIQSIYEDSQTHAKVTKQIKNNQKIINFNKQKGLNKQFHRSQQLNFNNHNHKVSQLSNFDHQKYKRISSAFTSPQVFNNKMSINQQQKMNQNNKKQSTNIQQTNTNNTPERSNFKFRTRSITDQQRKYQLANNLIRLSKQQQKRQSLIQKNKLVNSNQIILDHHEFKSRLINKYRLLNTQNIIQQKQKKQIKGKIIKNYYNYQLHKLNYFDDQNDFTQQQLVSFINKQKQFSSTQLPYFIDKPHNRSNSDQIINILQRLCKKLTINLRKQQLLNKKQNLIIKRYKNCLIFNILQKQKIIWYYQGKIYIGQGNHQEESSKQGYGIQYMAEKYIYKGKFKNNKKQGKGILILQNGDIYQGQWNNGQKEGYGKLYTKQNNTYYQGQFKNGKQHGNGLLKKLNDTNQNHNNIIDFKNTKCFNYNNIQIYKGTFSNGIKHGYGIQIFKNNDKYKGQYNKGLFHGKGKYIWSNGSIFYGDFIKGIRIGSGKWMSNCFKQKEGQCDIYVGGYANDKKNGTGRYIWKNGVVYEGGFEKDKKHGNGVLTNMDGRIVKGVWENNKLVKIISHSGGQNNKDQFNSQQNQLQNYDYYYVQQQNYGVNLIQNKGQQILKPSQLSNYD